MRLETITKTMGLELASRGGQLIFVPHEYIGKEPDTKFVYLTIRRIADQLQIPANVASFMCSDEENGLERSKRSFYWGKAFATDIIGPGVYKQPAHVADNPGHSSSIYLFFGHLGMYKNEADGRLLYGKVESERDGVLRPTCGAIFHCMQRLLGHETPEPVGDGELDFIGTLEKGIAPHKKEFLDAYNQGDDELERHSFGVKFLVNKNVDVHVDRLLKQLAQSTAHSNGYPPMPKLIFGGITINRYKYPDTTLLTHAYLIRDGISYDLTQTPIPQNGSRH